MDPHLKAALDTLGFQDIDHVPKLKLIVINFKRLCLKLHPDKNGGTKEANILFQNLMKAYELAGKVAESNACDDSDDEDLIARKMFRQFYFTAVQENLSSFTIKTEKTLNSLWCQILQASFGPPDDLGIHGKKFTVIDTCHNDSVKIFLTIYLTGKILIQAEANRHGLNLHFINDHLESLYAQVYNRKKLLRLQT